MWCIGSLADTRKRVHYENLALATWLQVADRKGATELGSRGLSKVAPGGQRLRSIRFTGLEGMQPFLLITSRLKSSLVTPKGSSLWDILGSCSQALRFGEKEAVTRLIGMEERLGDIEAIAVMLKH